MKKHTSGRSFSVPAAISVLRLCMIPLLVYLCGFRKNDVTTLAVFGISMLFDLFDGFSVVPGKKAGETGKTLDNVADKLTQAVLLSAMSGQFRLLLLPVVLWVANSVFVLVPMMSSFPVKADDVHNRVCTVTINLLLILHLTWKGLDLRTSACLTIVSMIIVFHIFAVQHSRLVSRS